MKKITIGVIGAGRIGKLHTENISRIIKANVKTIADPNLTEELIQWAKELGIQNISRNPEEVLNDKEIEAIAICSPSNTHADFIINAAQAGKHIFCEKPIDYDIKKIKKALSEVDKAEVKLQVGFMRRFDHNHRKVHEIVKSGAIGDPHIIKITSRDPISPPIEYVKNCGGFFYDVTIHDFDLARYLSLSEILEVYAIGSVRFDKRLCDIGDIDTCIVTLKFENGAFGIIDNSREANYGYDQRNEVFGSKGKVEISNDVDNTAVLSTSAGIFSEKPLWFFLERYNDAFYMEIDSFINCIIEDKKPLVTGIDGLKSVLCAMAAEKSLKEGKPVKISELE